MKKRILGLLICITLLFTGCGNSKVEEAKECIDNLYYYYDQLDKAEEELSYATEQAEINSLERDITLASFSVEFYTDSFKEIYSELSDKQREKVDKYLDEVVDARIADIWN